MGQRKFFPMITAHFLWWFQYFMIVLQDILSSDVLNTRPSLSCWKSDHVFFKFLISSFWHFWWCYLNKVGEWKSRCGKVLESVKLLWWNLKSKAKLRSLGFGLRARTSAATKNKLENCSVRFCCCFQCLCSRNGWIWETLEVCEYIGILTIYILSYFIQKIDWMLTFFTNYHLYKKDFEPNFFVYCIV